MILSIIRMNATPFSLLYLYFTIRERGQQCCRDFANVVPMFWVKFGLLTKVHIFTGPPCSKHKKQRRGSHPRHRIIRFKFIAVAERRQWSSAASRPRRKTRVKLCPHFWAAKVPSHQICRSRRAARYSGVVCLAKSRRTAGSK